MKVAVCKEIYTNNNLVYEDSPELRSEIETVIGQNIHSYVSHLVKQTSEAVGLPYPKDFYVRISQGHFGFAYRRFNKKASSVPDIMVGYDGDLHEFRITIIHEILHSLYWEEKVIEEKAIEIESQSVAR